MPIGGSIDIEVAARRSCSLLGYLESSDEGTGMTPSLRDQRRLTLRWPGFRRIAGPFWCRVRRRDPPGFVVGCHVVRAAPGRRGGTSGKPATIRRPKRSKRPPGKPARGTPPGKPPGRAATGAEAAKGPRARFLSGPRGRSRRRP